MEIGKEWEKHIAVFEEEFEQFNRRLGLDFLGFGRPSMPVSSRSQQAIADLTSAPNRLE